VGQLTIRLTFGVPAAAVDLAREIGSRLLRGDYRALADAGLCNAASIGAAADPALLACVGNNPEKLAAVREAMEAMKARTQAPSLVPNLVLEPYVA
jgi:helicase